jgi:hypothetical protein
MCQRYKLKYCLCIAYAALVCHFPWLHPEPILLCLSSLLLSLIPVQSGRTYRRPGEQARHFFGAIECRVMKVSFRGGSSALVRVAKSRYYRSFIDEGNLIR